MESRQGEVAEATLKGDAMRASWTLHLSGVFVRLIGVVTTFGGLFIGVEDKYWVPFAVGGLIWAAGSFLSRHTEQI
jgi:hypothetical protein